MEEVKKIPERGELPEETKWALEDLYATTDAWLSELKTLKEDEKVLTSYAGRLGESGKTLYDFLHAVEDTNVKADRLGNYCMRKVDEDTRNPESLSLQGTFMSTVVALNAACSFDTPEIMAISDETLDGFYRDYPALERYRRYLTSLRRRKPHTLSAQEETASTGSQEIAAQNGFLFSSPTLTRADAADILYRASRYPQNA